MTTPGRCWPAWGLGLLRHASRIMHDLFDAHPGDDFAAQDERFDLTRDRARRLLEDNADGDLITFDED